MMTDMKEILRFSEGLGCVCMKNVPMSSLTTFKIGGPAKNVIYPKTKEMLASVVEKCYNQGITPFVLGNGSNLLASDDGYDGIILCTEYLDELSVDDDVITCSAGVSVTRVCNYALENSLSGLEFAFGIPGSIGGAVFMNAGAYGGEFKDVVGYVTYVDKCGKISRIPAEDVGFGYRHSIFSDIGGTVVAAEIKLVRDDPALIKERMNDFISRRKSKQPLNYPSAGSVFKRPIGYYAGSLIEEVGLKGRCVGDAQVSEKHAGFIINKGNAKSCEVKELIKIIQDTVFENKNVKLETEILFLD